MRRVFGVVLAASLLASFAISYRVFAADDGIPCSNPRTATINDLGFTPGSKICPKDDSRINGGCDFNPYAVLESEFRGAPGITPQPGNNNTARAGLDSALACRLVKLLRFARDRGCNFKIVSAYRPYQGCQGTVGSCAPQGLSCHQYGLAADIGSTLQCIMWMKDQVLGVKQPNATFGVKIAYFSGDYSHVHIQCNETPGAQCSQSTPECNGGIKITPDTSGIPNPSRTTPTSNLSNTVRQSVAPQPAPAAQTAPAPAPTTPGQQLCTPQFTCTDGVMYYKTSSCTTQQYQVCTSGCSGNICAVPAGTSLISDLLTKTPTTTAATSTRQATSTFDLIGALVNPVDNRRPVAPTATSVNLTGLSGQGVVVLQAQPQDRTLAPTGPVYQLAPSSQQTFTSPDLAQSPQASPHTPQQLSMFQSILANLKTAVLAVLQYLKPFGGTPASEKIIPYNYSSE